MGGIVTEQCQFKMGTVIPMGYDMHRARLVTFKLMNFLRRLEVLKHET